jgi:hypothetical protein
LIAGSVATPDALTDFGTPSEQVKKIEEFSHEAVGRWWIVTCNVAMNLSQIGLRPR